MRIKTVRLKNYKRFTELTIADLPETARLVVLVGPNGTGKSSVFDSFLLKAKAAVNNVRLSGDTEQYYDKVPQSQTTGEVATRVGIEFHGADEGHVDWSAAFQVRSAYRNESDFRIQQLRATRPTDAEPRIARIIDPDESVSKNYQRMVWKRLQDLDRDAPEEVTIGEYRRESLGDLQKAMRRLFSDPGLSLQDFGGIQAGSFRFSKGTVADFHYKNLSSGEKAAFDILLDVFVKRDEVRACHYRTLAESRRVHFGFPRAPSPTSTTRISLAERRRHLTSSSTSRMLCSASTNRNCMWRRVFRDR